MAQFKPFSRMAVDAAAEQVAGARLGNQLTMAKLGAFEQEQADKNLYRQTMRNAMNPDGSINYKAAASELASQGLPDYAMELNKLSREQTESLLKQKLDQTKYMKDRLEFATPANWGSIRSDLISNGVASERDLPTDYGQAKPLIDQLHNQSTNFMKDMQALGITDPNEMRKYHSGYPESASEDWKGMKSSDTNSIRSGVAALVGGDYDLNSGQFIIKDTEQRKLAIKVSREASRIYDRGRGSIPHEEAVARAANSYGLIQGDRPDELPPANKTNSAAPDYTYDPEKGLQRVGPN